jgi:hypothetical protein
MTADFLIANFFSATLNPKLVRARFRVLDDLPLHFFGIQII